MESQRNRDQNPEQQQQGNNRPGAPLGFEGMNFEEQRGSLKNSDGAGVSYNREESMQQRNGKSSPNEQ